MVDSPKVQIFGKHNCKFCDNAKEAFSSIEMPFEYKMLDETLCIGNDPNIGNPRTLPIDWKTNGMIDILAGWTLHNQPVPLILVNNKAYKNLSAALDAVNYRERKKEIVLRKRNASKGDTRTDS